MQGDGSKTGQSTRTGETREQQLERLGAMAKKNKQGLKKGPVTLPSLKKYFGRKV